MIPPPRGSFATDVISTALEHGFYSGDPVQVRKVEKLKAKTLEAWVMLDNLTQRGGSVLTLEDSQSHFDGIVFGELAPGRWMAGSDFLRRTRRDQDSVTPESLEMTSRMIEKKLRDFGVEVHVVVVMERVGAKD